VADARRIFEWMAGRLDGRDPAITAREGVELMLAQPGVPHARVRAGGQDLASSGEEPAAALAVEVGRVRVEWSGPEEAGIAASAVATCVERACAGADAYGTKRRLVHDLRGALAVMAGHCEMLESGVWGAMSPEQLRSVRALARQVERLRELIERVREQP
jgi:signal transduction histidine kinase